MVPESISSLYNILIIETTNLVSYFNQRETIRKQTHLTKGRIKFDNASSSLLNSQIQKTLQTLNSAAVNLKIALNSEKIDNQFLLSVSLRQLDGLISTWNNVGPTPGFRGITSSIKNWYKNSIIILF